MSLMSSGRTRVWGQGVRVLAATVVIGASALAQPAGAALTAPQKACVRARHHQFSRRPRHLTTVPPTTLTSILGVLRRPGTPADKLPAEALAGIVHITYSALWLGAARLLDTVGRTRYFVVPGVYAPPPLPEACAKLEPPRVRRRYARALQLAPHGPVVTLEPYSSHETGGIAFTASQIQAGTASEAALGRSGSTTTAFYGLVPDGVASVTVTAKGAPPTTVPAANNFFLTQVSAPRVNQPDIITEKWYATDGTLIKTVSRRTVLHELTASLT